VDGKADPDDQVDQATEPPADGWLISKWLAPLLDESPRDQETYELLVYKARTGKTYAEVAEDHGITVAAMKSRTHELKTRFEPRWRRRRDRMLLLVLAGVATAVLLVAVLLAWLTAPSRPKITPDWGPPTRASAARDASAPPEDAFAPAQSATPPRRPFDGKPPQP
jgi:hypothetical protein